MIMTGLARLGRDAEVRYLPSGEAVCNLSLAFSYGKKGDDGKRPAQWVDASLWGKRAEAMAQYLLKGGMIFVALEDPHIETYQGKNGETAKLVARVMAIEFAGGKNEHAAGNSESVPVQKPAAAQKPASSGGFADFEDDIPF